MLWNLHFKDVGTEAQVGLNSTHLACQGRNWIEDFQSHDFAAILQP